MLRLPKSFLKIANMLGKISTKSLLWMFTNSTIFFSFFFFLFYICKLICRFVVYFATFFFFFTHISLLRLYYFLSAHNFSTCFYTNEKKKYLYYADTDDETMEMNFCSWHLQKHSHNLRIYIANIKKRKSFINNSLHYFSSSHSIYFHLYIYPFQYIYILEHQSSWNFDKTIWI